MKFHASSFETMFYITPALSVTRMQVSDRGTGAVTSLGWTLSLTWLCWECSVEIYNETGRKEMGL